MRRLALDLFCGEGGASMGLHSAGFDVIGVDIEPRRRYPFRFVQADAVRPPFDLSRFDFIWASPPCEAHTRVWRGQPERRLDYEDLIGPTRDMLAAAGVPFTLENVIGAPLRPDLILTGATFNLPIVRERIFECHGFPVPFVLAKQHPPHVNTRNGGLAMVAGRGGAMKGWNRRNWERPDVRAKLSARNSIAGWREAMQMPWASRDGIRKAIPPAYAEFVGRAALAALQSGRERVA